MFITVTCLILAVCGDNLIIKCHFKGTLLLQSEQTFNRAWNRCPSLGWTHALWFHALLVVTVLSLLHVSKLLEIATFIYLFLMSGMNFSLQLSDYWAFLLVHVLLKMSRVYCSKRRDHNGSFQTQHFLHGCTCKFISNSLLEFYSLTFINIANWITQYIQYMYIISQYAKPWLLGKGHLRGTRFGNVGVIYMYQDFKHITICCVILWKWRYYICKFKLFSFCIIIIGPC